MQQRARGVGEHSPAKKTVAPIMTSTPTVRAPNLT
jgi:hypothetical protein